MALWGKWCWENNINSFNLWFAGTDRGQFLPVWSAKYAEGNAKGAAQNRCGYRNAVDLSKYDSGGKFERTVSDFGASVICRRAGVA